MAKLRFFLSAAAACFAASTQAWAQQAQAPANDGAQTPPPSHAAAAAANDEVVVTGTHSDETRIDRHVYSVRNDPIAQTSSLSDILGRLPAITVAPSGQIRLLGTNPTIQIDGQTVPGATLTQVLRTMTGDQVDRIEVITNPSAQYSAQASGGIINIITRQTFGRGIGGSLLGSYDTTDSYVATLSPTWTRGPFSLATRLSYNRNLSFSDSTLTRDVFATSDVVNEIGHTDQHGDVRNGYFSLGYRPNNRVSANASVERTEFQGNALGMVSDTENGAPLFTRTSQQPGSFTSDRATAAYSWNGAHSGESLTFNATGSRFQSSFNQIATTFPASGPTALTAAPSLTDGRNASLKLDYQRPFGAQLLQAGAAYDLGYQDSTNTFTTLLGPPNPNDYQETLHGRQSTPAAYVTYQFPVGHLTFLPGLRFEDFEQDVNSSAAHAHISDPRLFPTLHVRRNLMPGLDLDASFTRRISHPSLGSIDPGLRFIDSTHAVGGNPNLRPSLTNAFEASLNYQKGTNSVGFVFYDRITDDTLAQSFEVTPGGVTIVRPINAGTNEQRGLRVSVQHPFGRNWRLSVATDLLDRSFDQLSNGVITHGDEFEYNGNATLEYRDVDQNRVGATQIQLTAQWSGPTHSFQSSFDQYSVVNLTWRRTLTDRVAALLTLNDIFDTVRARSTFRTDQLEERTLSHGVGNGNGGQRAQLTLTYQLGASQNAAH